MGNLPFPEHDVGLYALRNGRTDNV
jgi:hypothetical protein